MIKKIASGVGLALLSMSAQAIVLGNETQDAADRVTIRASNMAEFPVCGGTLVSDRWVLTAAHCVVMGEGVDASTYSVTAPGNLSITANVADVNSASFDNFYTVSHVVVHPNYTRFATINVDKEGDVSVESTSLNNDIALLYLTRPVSGAQIANLASPEDMADIEARLIGDWNDAQRVENVQVFGWGTTTPDAADASQLLQETTLTFLPIDVCHDRLDVNNDVPNSLIDSVNNVTKVCTLPTQNELLDPNASTQYGNSACKGDSGGPLVDVATGKQIGIVSGAPIILPTCGSLTIPTFFTRVDTYFDWIDGYTSADEPPTATIIEPNFITNASDGNEPCYDGISTSNCDFRGEDDGGSLGFFGLGLLALLGWRRR